MGVQFFLNTIVFIIVSVSCKGSPAPRIAGGYEAPKFLGQYHASLQNLTGHHVCGGAVISNQHIVTAAHCVKGADTSNIHVVVGTTNLDTGGQRCLIDSITIHKDFNFDQRLNDIAVLKMKTKFNKHYVNKLKLYYDDLNEGDPVILIGFGSEKANGAPMRQMRVLDSNVFNQETCKYAMRYTRNLTDDMFCTFTHVGEGTCHGDSGSPVLKGDKLIGIVSWGIPCAVGFPDVHTKVSSHLQWIREQIEKSNTCVRKRSGKGQNDKIKMFFKRTIKRFSGNTLSLH